MKTTHISFNTYASEEHLTRIVNAKSDLLRFAGFITHDKDVWNKRDEEKNPAHVVGTTKTTHRHLVIWLKSMREPTDICAWFKKALDDNGELANTLWEETRHAGKMVDYLTHSTEEAIEQGKHQYKEQDIKVLYGDLHEYVESVTPFEERNRKADELKEKEATKREAQEESIDNMINDIIAKKPPRYMAKQYGRDYIKNRKAYHEFAGAVWLDEGGDISGYCEITGVSEEWSKRIANIEYRKGVGDGFAKLVQQFRYSEDEDARIFVEKARLLLRDYESETSQLERMFK